MSKAKVFQAEQFTATQWDSAEQKAKFANQFVDFCLSGFAPRKFPKWFYNRLSMCFMHIAHYNLWGFYNTFFTTYEGIGNFIHATVDGPYHGDPKWTYSDVECALGDWMNGPGIVTKMFAAARKNEAERDAFGDSHE